jgi:hypothetical protein
MWFDTSVAHRIERKVDRALFLLDLVLKQETKIMADIHEVLTNAEAAAKANSDAEDAAMALLTTLAKAIADLKATGTDPATVARIQALADGLNAKAAALAAAVVADTPAA